MYDRLMIVPLGVPTCTIYNLSNVVSSSVFIIFDGFQHTFPSMQKFLSLIIQRFRRNFHGTNKHCKGNEWLCVRVLHLHLNDCVVYFFFFADPEQNEVNSRQLWGRLHPPPTSPSSFAPHAYSKFASPESAKRGPTCQPPTSDGSGQNKYYTHTHTHTHTNLEGADELRACLHKFISSEPSSSCL